jgi:DNA-binding response OmpR family regulator
MKVMVVEDDAALREIYSIRIAADGYEVVSAGDGEEALAVAVREKPDLILSDVMMPKISGFDMLDILRTTPETANIKVIMMTALSGDDQRARGERLGANRYLVKSQVGIEDVVNAIHEELGDRAAPAQAAAGQAPTPATPAAAPAAPGVAAAPQQVAPATISNDSPAAGQIFEVKNGLGSQGYNGTAQA